MRAAEDGGTWTFAALEMEWRKGAWQSHVLSGVVCQQVCSGALRLPLTISRHCAVAARRTMDKMGGLDNYLLGTPDDKLDSERGVALKRSIRERKAVAAQAAMLPPAAAAAIMVEAAASNAAT